MSDAFEGGEQMDEVLDGIGKRFSGELSVGFMAGATYPDGTGVPDVAFTNEFGDPANHQPARPFFRRMIAQEKPTWPGKVGELARNEDYDGKAILGLMGEDIKGALQESINDLWSPPLSPFTVAKKGFDKPLIETSHMINSITATVDD